MNSYDTGLGAFGVLLGIMAVVLGILWLILPFAIFGIKERLDRLTNETRRTNALLAQLVGDSTPTTSNDSMAAAAVPGAVGQSSAPTTTPRNQCVICSTIMETAGKPVYVKGEKLACCSHHEEAHEDDKTCTVCGEKFGFLADKHPIRLLQGQDLHLLFTHTQCHGRVGEVLAQRGE